MNSFAQKLLSLIALSAVLATTVPMQNALAFSMGGGSASEDAYQIKYGMGNLRDRLIPGAQAAMGNMPPSDSGSGTSGGTGMGNMPPSGSGSGTSGGTGMGNMPSSGSGSGTSGGTGMGNMPPSGTGSSGSTPGRNLGNLTPGAGKDSDMGNKAPNLADMLNGQNMGNTTPNGNTGSSQSSGGFDVRGMGNGVSNEGYGSSAVPGGYQYAGNQVPNDSQHSQGFTFGSQTDVSEYGNQVSNSGYGSSAIPGGYQYTGNMVSNSGSTGSSDYGNQVANNGAASTSSYGNQVSNSGNQTQGFTFGSSNPYGNSYGNQVPYGYGNSLVPGGYVYTGSSNMGNLVPNGSSTTSNTGNLVANNTGSSTNMGNTVPNNTVSSTPDYGNLVPNNTTEATELTPQTVGDDGAAFISPDDYYKKYYRASEISTCNNRPYPRDIDGHWSEIYVRRLYDLCVVEGYEDGLFHPNAYVTRAELIKMGLFANGIEPNNGCYDRDCGSPFNDLDEWQSQWVRPAYDRGIIQGYAYNQLRPNQPITRAEAVKIVLATYGYQPLPVSKSFFNDVSGWSTGWIEQAHNIGLVQGIGNGNFDPDRPITRAEAAKIVAKMIEYWATNVAKDNAYRA